LCASSAISHARYTLSRCIKVPRTTEGGGVVVYGVTHNVPIVMMHCVVTQLFHYIILYMADGARWLTGAI
jgi:hypothetical protein